MLRGPVKSAVGACVDAPKVHVMLVGSCSVDTNSVANRQTENLPLSNSGHNSFRRSITQTQRCASPTILKSFEVKKGPACTQLLGHLGSHNGG
jgi:hypothetical protein